MAIKAIVHIDPDGSYRAEVPGLPGVAAGAATLDDLRPALRDALADWIASAQSAVIEQETDQGGEFLTLELDLVELCPLGHVPNDATAKALRDADAGKGLLGPFRDAEEMFRELGGLSGGGRR